MIKKRKNLFITIGILTFIVVAYAIYFVLYAKHHQTTDDSYVRGHISHLSFRIPGYIKKIHVKNNQFVLKDSLLATLDDRELKINKGSAETKLEAQKIGLQELKESIKLDHFKVEKATAQIKISKAQLVKNKTEYNRLLSLLDKSYISQSKIDAAKALCDIDEATIEANMAELNSATIATQLKELKIGQFQSLIKNCDLKIEKTNLNLEYSQIRAPTDGIVTNRQIEAGMYVNPGAYILSLVPLNTLWIEANFKETQIHNMKKNQNVSISVDAYPGIKIKGKIDSITPSSTSEFALLAPSNATGNFTKVVRRIPVKIIISDLTNLTKPLYPGMSTEVDVDTKS